MLTIRHLVARAVMAGALTALSACAGLDSQQLAERLTDVPRQGQVANVPFYPQEENYCGPASLAMTLAWSGVPSTQDEVAAQVYTPGRDGTLQADIVAATRRAGRLAVPVRDLDHLLQELAAGHPVLVFQNLGLGWYPQWHYAVAVGYDLDAGELVLRSGREREHRVALTTFDWTWRRADRWALLTLPPTTLPAAADEEAVLQAAVGLEQAGQHEAASSAFTAAERRWPNSLGALMGRGNAHYAMGDLAGAETAFRAAVTAHPEAAAAWNNLAHVLAERGDKTAALDAAQTAVELGGTNASTYRATLREITGKDV